MSNFCGVFFFISFIVQDLQCTSHRCLSYREEDGDGEREGVVDHDPGVEERHGEHHDGGQQVDQVIGAQGQHQSTHERWED